MNNKDLFVIACSRERVLQVDAVRAGSELNPGGDGPGGSALHGLFPVRLRQVGSPEPHPQGLPQVGQGPGAVGTEPLRPEESHWCV